MVCVPTESVEFVKLVPLPPESVTVPSKLVPSIVNCTVPLGVPKPGGTALTAAVQVTGLSKYDGFDEEMSAMLAPALLIVCVKFAEALPLKLVSPLYTAVTM